MVVGVLALTLPPLGGSVARADTPLPTVYVDGDPVAPPPKDQAGNLLKGTGLCGAFRLADTSDMATLARVLFPQRPANFPTSGVDEFQQAINDFMDGKGAVAGSPSDPQVHYSTLLTPFDLASLATLPGINSKGDYIDTPECASYSSAGCRFPASGITLDTTPLPAFGSRFRGFILIPQGTEKIPMHIGFFTQDEVAMRIFQKPAQGQTNAKVYEVISRSPTGPTGAYRVTNTITFKNPGIYPIEILHASDQDPAVLEMVVLNSDPGFTDLDGPVAATPSLQISRFSPPLPPTLFFQTSSGALPFDGQPATCQQCPRQFANLPTQPKNGTICPQGLFCNEAAVCSPCVGDQFCGKSCRVCTSPEPYCVRDPASAGADYTCVECREDPDCKTGQKCVTGKCINPCPCCPDAPFCVTTDPGQPSARNCSQCRTDSDCGDRKCDLLNGHCVDKLADCRTDDRCGPSCVNCLATTKDEPTGPRPHCMDGSVCVQCRYDVDCADQPGTYCRSGDCVPCTHDRHCGASCRSCGIDINVAPDGTTILSNPTEKPFCLSNNGEAASAVCVRCLNDAQCGLGGTCDLTTHQCNNTCSTPCEDGKVCDGTRCVQCFTSAQCKCGQCIDGTCTENCGDSTDCRSNQCCAQDSALCIDGRCKPGLTAHGGGLCCTTTGGSIGLASDPVAPAPGRGPLWAMLAALGLLTLGRTASLRAARVRQQLDPASPRPGGPGGPGGPGESRN